MSIESDIFDRLTGFAGLSALVSTRVFPVAAPPNVTFPIVVYSRVSAERPSVMGVDSGIVRARYQVTAWDGRRAGDEADYDSARAVAEQVRQALQRWRKASATVVQDTFLQSEFVGFDDDAEAYFVTLEFEINHLEA